MIKNQRKQKERQILRLCKRTIKLWKMKVVEKFKIKLDNFRKKFI